MPTIDGIHRCPISRECENLHQTPDGFTPAQRVRLYVSHYRSLTERVREVRRQRYNRGSNCHALAALWRDLEKGLVTLTCELDEAGLYSLTDLLDAERRHLADRNFEAALKTSATIKFYLEDLEKSLTSNQA